MLSKLLMRLCSMSQRQTRLEATSSALPVRVHTAWRSQCAITVLVEFDAKRHQHWNIQKTIPLTGQSERSSSVFMKIISQAHLAEQELGVADASE